MVLKEITEAGKQISGFERLPVTAQVSALYPNIQAARQLSMPLSAICEAMNQAGSTVTLRYLRQALSVVKRRLENNGGMAEGSPVREKPGASLPAKRLEPMGNPIGKTAKEQRENKAEQYTAQTINNPLLRQQRSKE